MRISFSRKLATVAGLALAFTSLGLPATADAAVIDDVVTDIVVTPPNPGFYDDIRTDIDWCVPNGTMAGDTFDIAMPPELIGFPLGFDLLSPNGQVVATVEFNGDPAIATFTMTAFAENNTGVCGDAFVESSLRDLSVSGTEVDLTFVINGDVEFVQTIEVEPFTGIGREGSRKTGRFTDPIDQCRLSLTDCINWSIESALGPLAAVTFEDIAATGLVFNCDTLELFFYSVDGQGLLDERTTAARIGATVDQTCTEDSFTLTTGPLPDGLLARVRIRATPDAVNPDGGIEYPNTATITSERLDGSERVETVGAVLRSTNGGGNGFGDALFIQKVDADGNDADLVDDAVLLADGTTTLNYTVVNTGTTNVLDIVVADVVVSGGTVSGLTCNFSEADPAAPTAGTSWAGPFVMGASFSCTAELTGVTSAEPHENVASVSGTGEVSGQPVSDDDPYHAVSDQPPATTTTLPPTTLPPTTTVPPTTAAPTTAAPTTAAPTTVEVTTTTVVPIPTITIQPNIELPQTGRPAGGIIAIFGALLIGLGLAARRFSRPAL